MSSGEQGNLLIMIGQRSLGGYFIIPLHIISLVVELTKVNCNKNLILFHVHYLQSLFLLY